MNEGKNNEDFTIYIVNDYHFRLLERVIGYKLIDRYKAFARHHFTLGNIAEDGHVFRKIKTAETMQSPQQSYKFIMYVWDQSLVLNPHIA